VVGWRRVPRASATEALGIGTLMNARGLIKLIIINIGPARHHLAGGFAMLVIMAVVTTLMAFPSRPAGRSGPEPIVDPGHACPRGGAMARRRAARHFSSALLRLRDHTGKALKR
jgi:Kef-type K+ transport system membrane component KefB